MDQQLNCTNYDDLPISNNLRISGIFHYIGIQEKIRFVMPQEIWA